MSLAGTAGVRSGAFLLRSRIHGPRRAALLLHDFLGKCTVSPGGMHGYEVYAA